VEEITRRVQGEGGFLSVVRDLPGFKAYYFVDCGDGALMTITVADDQAGVEASVSAAADWVSDNAADLIEGAPTVSNGEVVAEA
jgi:hypothetical protein